MTRRCASGVLRRLGVHYPDDNGRELHAFYPLMSITHNRRIHLEVACPDADPHIPSLFSVYPTCDWHERETYDFFGIIFDGHPGLTRIEMPDDWVGHPQRKGLPLGGVPVEYHGAQIPAGSAESLPMTVDEPVVVLGGRDWDDVLTAARSGEAGRAHRGQHGSAAPVDARRAAADPRDRGRDGGRSPLRHRLSAHRHREEPGVPHLDPGRHLRHPDGLLSPFFNETAYCLGVERLLGITDAIPQRASVIRVMLMEFNRISSHLVALAARRDGTRRDDADVLRLPGTRTDPDVVRGDHGLGMNNAYIRPGGLAADLPEDGPQRMRDLLKILPGRLRELEALLTELHLEGPHPGHRLPGFDRLHGTGHHRPGTALHRPAHDLRKAQPYCGYETYDFDVITETTADCYGRYLIRVREMHESLRIIGQCLERLEPGPVMIEDKKLAWPADLKLGPDGLGNSPSTSPRSWASPWRA